MNTKYCLLIDNEDQTTSIENIKREANLKRIEVECHQFNIGSPEREDLLTNNEIDLEKVKKKFNEEFKNIAFDIIAFDWDLDDSKIDGIELIRQFNHLGIRKSSPKILYSGLLRERIQTYCDDYKKEKIDFNELWNKLNTLIKLNIVDFVKRDNYEKDIVNFLSKEEFNSDIFISKELQKFSHLSFQGLYEQFKGMTLGEIAEIIDTDKTRGINFKKEIIEMAISHMIELNDNE